MLPSVNREVHDFPIKVTHYLSLLKGLIRKNQQDLYKEIDS